MMLGVSVLGAAGCGAAALAGGFIDAISGGGGLLSIPALMLAGAPPHAALGTNKIAACCGTMVSLTSYARSHLVNWRAAAWGVGFSLLGSWLGAALAISFSPEALGKILVALLPVAMLAIFLPRNDSAANVECEGLRFWLGLPLVCLALGFYDGFFGPAAGTFLILGLFWILKMGLLNASATAKVFNLGSNVSAAVSFAVNGVVLWPLAMIMAVCFMAGNWLGSAFAIKIGPKAVRRFLVFTMALLLGTLVWRYFLAPA